MTISKQVMQRAMQEIMRAFHLPHFSDKDILELGRELCKDSDNEWYDTHELIVKGYSDEFNDTDEKVGGYNQW